MKNLRTAAELALAVQDACNLSGVANSFVCALSLLDSGLSTREKNKHPIVTLFLLKMAELNGCGSSLQPEYAVAEAECKRLAGKEGN